MALILVVDDDQAVRLLLSRTLIKQGHTVIEAADGQAAIRLFRSHTPDLVITDLVMPNKEGLEMILELKGIYPQAHIIAISGGGRCNPDSYLEMAKYLGAARTLSKPIGLEQFIEAVDEVLLAN